MPEARDIAAVIRALRSAMLSDNRFFLVGAYARDLRLQKACGIMNLRNTLDVDFAVMVPDWGTFDQLCQALLHRQADDFTRSPQPHKLIFTKSLEVDILPFGAIAGPEGTISFPQNGQVMSILGFDDAYAAATELLIEGEPVHVVSIPGFVLLKLMAWHDNPDRSKDAEDLAAVFQAYTDLPGNENRMWEGSDCDLVNAPDFDYVMTGVRLLGRDLSRMITRPETRHMILQILARESAAPFPLARSMSNYCRNDINLARNLLEQLHMGVEETSP